MISLGITTLARSLQWLVYPATAPGGGQDMKHDKATVRVKADSRGDSWAYETAQRMHARNADKADRSTAQRESRKAARAERKAQRAA